jgi:hypothetical protein
MTSAAPPGWYSDPSGAAGQRWWDGHAWTAHVAPVVAPAATVAQHGATILPGGATAAPMGLQPSVGGYAATSSDRGSNLAATNRYALITLGVVLLYIVIAAETRLVIIGFLPLGLSLRSKRAGEPLAPLAIVAACLAIALAAFLILG